MFQLQILDIDGVEIQGGILNKWYYATNFKCDCDCDALLLAS
jgi:hypothetical protein